MVVVTPDTLTEGLDPRAVVVGIDLGDARKAYPLDTLKAQSPIADRVAGRDLLVVLGDDGETVRVFDRQVDGTTLDLFQDVQAEGFALTDPQTGTRWNFLGEAIEGELAGRQLERVALVKEFWFDWKQFNPDSRLYRAGF